MNYEECRCGRGWYDPIKYRTCYTCFLERREAYIECIWCERWHSPEYATCYQCSRRPGRDDAARTLRLDILMRDDFTCQHCGTREQLEVDHIKPCSAGGAATPWNLQVLCHDCNQNKGTTWNLGWEWDAVRIRLMHLYFTFGWAWLSEDEQAMLRADADDYQRHDGSNPFGWHAHYQLQGPTRLRGHRREVQTLSGCETETPA